MTPEELREKCKRQIDIWDSENANIVVTLTTPISRNRKTIRMGHRQGPVGQVMHFGTGPRVMFKAREVLDYLDKIGDKK